MTLSIDEFYGRTYDRDEYNCAHFVADLWHHVTGDDIKTALAGFLMPASVRHARDDLRRQFTRLRVPVTPCVVLLRDRQRPPHVGIYYKGKVAHITEVGVQYQPLDVVSVGYKTVGFYVC